LIEAQDEIQEMKRKFKIINHQIEQLKEEISAKDLALVKEHFDHMKVRLINTLNPNPPSFFAGSGFFFSKPFSSLLFALSQVEKEKESLRFELNKAKQQIKEADTAISSQKSEIEKLNHIINEADQERLRQKKEYDIVINERDILGTQLIRRNDELALLYEKIKIQQSTLNKGQIQYRDRLNEIRVLKIKLNDLKRELHILKNSVANIDVLKVRGRMNRDDWAAGRPSHRAMFLLPTIPLSIYIPAPPSRLVLSPRIAARGPPPWARAAARAHQGEGPERRAGEPSECAPLAQA
jgi:hypothetical protein